MTRPKSNHRPAVTVRMYRQGLGDCFLVTFPGANGKPFTMLIDCGVLLGTEDASARMTDVAQHIKKTTKGRINVLVATHEHWDHLSGFDYARTVFDEMTFDEVWVAWTEDPHDDVASRLRDRRSATLKALHAAVAKLSGGSALTDQKSAEWIKSVLDFHGEPLAAGAQGLSRIARAMKYVVDRSNSPRFLRPNQPPITLPGVAGVRVFVLGPPKDEAFLTRSNPSKKAPEVYEKSLALTEETAFFAAALAHDQTALSPAEADLVDLTFPFDATNRIPVDAAKQIPFFRENYGYGSPSAANAPEWRRIENDWLQGADSLALKLDSDTNNTSLALAVELRGDDSTAEPIVLLFPGDAQVGNWLSWQSLKWTEDDGLAKGETITGPDLVKRTVFYKVGHHSSHNATLREQGLELMNSPDLVAMIPVDEAMAHKPKGSSPKGWDMPFAPLLARLEEKAKGRVIRLDNGPPTAKPQALSQEDWDQFQSRCRVDKLFIEYQVGGDDEHPSDG